MKRLANFFSKNARVMFGAGRMALYITLLTAAATMGPMPSSHASDTAPDLRTQLVQIAEQDATVQSVLALGGDDRAAQTAHLACMSEQAGERDDSRGDIRPLDLGAISDCAKDKMTSFADDLKDPEVQAANRCLAGMLAKAEWRPDNITQPATELRACGMGWIVDFFELEDDEPAKAPAASRPM